MVEPFFSIPDSDEDLLKECDVETFRSGGRGGQHVNKVETGVRLRHRPSGIVVQSTTERSQYKNKKLCLDRLRQKLAQRNRRRKPRIATREPAAARAKARILKERQSEKKQRRKPPLSEE